MGRKRFNRKKRFNTRRALLTVILFTIIVLAVIGVIARQPSWYRALLPEHKDSHVSWDGDGYGYGGAAFYGGIDADEWVLPAVVVVVSLSGISVWVILLKANR